MNFPTKHVDTMHLLSGPDLDDEGGIEDLPEISGCAFLSLSDTATASIQRNSLLLSS
jgi:hypothetical protein